MDNQLSLQNIGNMNRRFGEDPQALLAMNAVVKAGVKSAASDYGLRRRMRYAFSIETHQGKVTNQKSTGRCWMFAALNAMRVEVMEKLNLESFELSQSYILFYDKLEKANYFYESILKTLDAPQEGRLMAHLLSQPLNDGGQWDMFRNIIEKYGCVPKDNMPESFHSSNTSDMTALLTQKLRSDAHDLRSAHGRGAKMEQLSQMRQTMMEGFHHALCVCLGTPPDSVVLEVRNKDKEFHRDGPMTPMEFYRKYIGWDLSGYVSVINAPTRDKPFGRTYTVSYLGNVVGGHDVLYLNLPIGALRRAAVAQMKDGHPVWFGCDVGKMLDNEWGSMDMRAYDYPRVLGFDLRFDKAR
jgi:bleomycin hydrolase